MNTNGLKRGDPTPDGWFDGGRCCPAADRLFCTATEGHDGPHVATGGGTVLAVWS